MNHVGLIQLWLLDTIPEGFLVCDGSELSQTTYADLHAAIGDMYGPASPGMFKLPDLRGYFPRSYTGPTTMDPDSNHRDQRGDGTSGNAVGTTQPSMYKAHTHGWTNSASNGGGAVYNHTSWTTTTVAGTPSSQMAGGFESRPKNIYVVPLIKY